MTEEELKNKCKERAKIFQQAMESCHSSSPIDCIEWFADRIAELETRCNELFFQVNEKIAKIDELENKLTEKVTLESLDVVSARIKGLEKENTKLEQKLEQTEKDLADYQFNYPTIKELEKENAELKKDNSEWEKASDKWKSVYELTNNQLTKAKIYLEQLVSEITVGELEVDPNILQQAENFLKETK